jgi:hypothetical protein
MLEFQSVLQVSCLLHCSNGDELTYGGSVEMEGFPDLRRVIEEVLKRLSSANFVGI